MEPLRYIDPHRWSWRLTGTSWVRLVTTLVVVLGLIATICYPPASSSAAGLRAGPASVVASVARQPQADDSGRQQDGRAGQPADSGAGQPADPGARRPSDPGAGR